MNEAARFKAWNDYETPHADLREFIERTERAGQLLRIPGADWKFEMGALAEIVARATKALRDEIKAKYRAYLSRL